jgi:NAD-dependent dihydropyrimidine dehydrogenase PreA subunit
MTSSQDRDRLRRLVGEYATLVNSETMDARREIWRRSNRLEERTIPFQIEDNGTFFADLTPPLECAGAEERGCEAVLLRALTNFRLIDDDRVFPRCYLVPWVVRRTSLCPELQIKRVPDATGRELGYETNTPLADLAHSLHKLEPTEFSVDRDETYRQVELFSGLFGDLLPVAILGRQASSPGTGLANHAVHLIGMDDFYLAMLDQPENIHAFFDFIATDNARFLDWLEAEGLITTGFLEFDCGSGSCVYTDELPRRALAPGEPARCEDIWGFVEAQEAVGVSPAMYAEFIHPYQRRQGDRYGLINYGCCEPVHDFWPTLAGFASLRKVTVSPWCDVASIAASAGRQVVLSRKPHPLKLCGPTFDPADFTATLQETLDLTQDNFVELIFRDTCTLCGAMQERVAEACGILHRLVGH